MAWDGNIRFTDQDILQLIQDDPLAAERLKAIALRRMLEDAHRQLDAAGSCKTEENGKVVPLKGETIHGAKEGS